MNCRPASRSRIWFFLILPAVLLAACGENSGGEFSIKKIVGEKQLFTSEQFRQGLAAGLAPADSALVRDSGSLGSLYKSAGYKPLWLTEAGSSESAGQLIKDLDNLRDDGLDPDHYGATALVSRLEALKREGDLESAIAFDTACTRAYLAASHDLLLGRISPKRADSLWFHGNDTDWEAPGLLKQLAQGGDYPGLARYRSGIPTYALLRAEFARYRELQKDSILLAMKAAMSGREAPDSLVVALINRELPWIRPLPGDTMGETKQQIRDFQLRNGLAGTGKADSPTLRRLRQRPDSILPLLAANMERLRWLPRELAPKHVLVNIPLMELFLRKDGQDAFHMRVVVGKTSRQTPVLSADMQNIVFSPSWGVPPVILKRDVLPGITKKGSAYLAKKGLQAYDRKGRKISASAVNAKNFRSLTFRQPPGARNALGDIKFNLPNPWDIYLHDTPNRSDFKKRYRALSSGCIRVEQPRELAEYILRDMEGRDHFDQWKIDSLISLRKTRFEQLKQHIPVHIIYLTAFEDETGDHLRLLPDIYGKDRKLIAALGRANAGDPAGPLLAKGSVDSSAFNKK